MKVVAAFQRCIKNGTKAEVEGYSLEELRRADQQLGTRDTDAGYRLALKERIEELEEIGERQSTRKHESTKAKYVLGRLSLESLRELLPG